MPDEKLVLCIKWGTMYGPEYVNVMYGMVARNLTGAFRLICFTDDGEGIRPEVECLPLPELGVEVPAEAPGKWPKQALWAKDLFGLEGVALFVDLDSVIVDSIDPYFEYGDPDDVITARNWVKPFSKMAQTSVFRFKIGAHSYLLDHLREDPQLMVRYQFEQNYVSSCLKGGVKFWPKAWTKHFSRHCMGPWPLRYLRPPKQPAGARIITFPGSPKPPAAARGSWQPTGDPRTPLKQIKWVFGESAADKPKLKLLKRYLQPTEWVGHHWRE